MSRYWQQFRILLGLSSAIVAFTGCASEPKAIQIPDWAQVSELQLAEADRLMVPVAFEEEKSGIRFVLIPGSQDVAAFYLAETEVTNQCFQRFKADHQSAFNSDDRPANMLRHSEAQAFAKWLGAQYRLPTEEEWEHACRAGTRTRYSFGDKFDHQYANAVAGDPLKPEPRNETKPVRSYRPNQWGLYDMHGNVMEWCAPMEGDEKLGARGGSWRYGADYVESGARFKMNPGSWDPDTGFRMACSLTSVLNAQEK